MAIRTTTIRTTTNESVLSGILTKPINARSLFIRAFIKLKKMQLSLFDDNVAGTEKLKIEELFEAYFNCRKNKRYTLNALAFETDYENNLVKLYEEINNGTYSPGRSLAFIVTKPVKREIFADGFRDRVVHHWLVNKLNPLFEQLFINDSYACRTGKGTHYGINRINGFIKSCINLCYRSFCYFLFSLLFMSCGYNCFDMVL